MCLTKPHSGSELLRSKSNSCLASCHFSSHSSRRKFTVALIQCRCYRDLPFVACMFSDTVALGLSRIEGVVQKSTSLSKRTFHIRQAASLHNSTDTLKINTLTTILCIAVPICAACSKRHRSSSGMIPHLDDSRLEDPLRAASTELVGKPIRSAHVHSLAISCRMATLCVVRSRFLQTHHTEVSSLLHRKRLCGIRAGLAICIMWVLQMMFAGS